MTMPIRPMYLGAMLLFGSLAMTANAGALPLAGYPFAQGSGAGGWRILPVAGMEHAGPESAIVEAGDLEIANFWARAMLPGQPSAGGYLTISSKGGGDRLLSASSPASGKVEIHEMKMVDEVMVMRPVEGGLEIPAGGTVELKPGGLHLMFMSPSAPFTEGETVPVTLEFEKAGAVEVVLPVRAASGGHSGGHSGG